MERDIVIAGYAGERGAICAAAARQEELRRRFRADCAAQLLQGAAPKSKEILERLRAAGIAAEEYRVAGEGGVLAELYRMTRERRAGLRLWLKRIPLRQDTTELCELYGLNPYRLYSDCVILVTESGMRLAEIVATMGIPAACVGYLTDGLDKLIVDKEETEYLNRPEVDELFKLVPDAIF